MKLSITSQSIAIIAVGINMIGGNAVMADETSSKNNPTKSMGLRGSKDRPIDSIHAGKSNNNTFVVPSSESDIQRSLYVTPLYQIRSRANQRCMQVQPNTDATASPCIAQSTDQKFYWSSGKMIHSTFNNLCLTALSGSQSAQVYFAQCDPNNYLQWWNQDAGKGTIMPQFDTSLCVAVNQCMYGLTVEPCDNSDRTKFRLPVGATSASSAQPFVSLVESYCLDVSGNSVTVGMCNKAKRTQYWSETRWGSGVLYYNDGYRNQGMMVSGGSHYILNGKGDRFWRSGTRIDSIANWALQCMEWAIGSNAVRPAGCNGGLNQQWDLIA